MAKMIGVTWQTINMWERGAFKPNDINENKLRKLLENVKNGSISQKN